MGRWYSDGLNEVFVGDLECPLSMTEMEYASYKLSLLYSYSHKVSLKESSKSKGVFSYESLCKQLEAFKDPYVHDIHVNTYGLSSEHISQLKRWIDSLDFYVYSEFPDFLMVIRHPSRKRITKEQFLHKIHELEKSWYKVQEFWFKDCPQDNILLMHEWLRLTPHTILMEYPDHWLLRIN